VWLTATILQEVLQGADTPDRFTRWDRVLGELPLVNAPDTRTAARSAAHLYARCRWAGVTPRSANDAWTWDVWPGDNSFVLITDAAGDPTQGYGTYVKAHYLCRSTGIAICN
jgi:hypothetical protein